MLTGALELSAERTILWVLKDLGSETTVASGVVYTGPETGTMGGLSTARDSPSANYTMRVAVDGYLFWRMTADRFCIGILYCFECRSRL